MTARDLRSLLTLGALTALLAGCPDEGKRPIGAACTSDGQCDSGLCAADQCLEPGADSDGDGLINSIEAALGTNPTQKDTDGDGVDDGDEVVTASTPVDTDADGKTDALESALDDHDQDCIKDQFDADDDAKEVDPAALAAKLCRVVGVCGAPNAGVTAQCATDGSGQVVHTCDYGQVAGYEAEETRCDDTDNDCDGATDEPFAAGGSVSFTDDDGVAGKVKGDTCGIGACAGGTVVCADATTLGCSSAGSGTDERCDGVDNDCDGATDEPFRAGGTVTYHGGPFAADAGKVLGDACGAGACASGSVICDTADATRLTCSSLGALSPEACDGVDNDCDGETDLGADLLACTAYYADGDEDGYGPDDSSACLCAADETHVTPYGGDCNDDSGKFHPDADPICGDDADCDTFLTDVGEACDDGNDVFGDGCLDCAVTETALTDSLRSRYRTKVAAFDAGGFAACWQEGAEFNRAGTSSQGGVTCSFHGPDGAEVGEFVRDDNSTLYHRSVAVGALAGGAAVVAWTTDDQSSYTSGVWAQRVDIMGVPLGDAVRVDDVTTYYLDTGLYAVPAGGGGFAVMWRGNGEGDEGSSLRARAFGADDLPLGPSVPVATSYSARDFVIQPFGEAGFLAAWLDYSPNSGVTRVAFQRLMPNGTLDGEPGSLSISSEGEGQSIDSFALAVSAGGAFTLYYTEITSFELWTKAIRAQDFKADFSLEGEPRTVLDDAEDFGYRYAAARLLDGTTLLVFSGYGQSEQSTLTSAVLVPADAAAPSVVVALQTSGFTESSDESDVAASPVGPFVVGWSSYLEFGSAVYFQRLAADGTKLLR